MSLSVGIGATDPELVGPGRKFNWQVCKVLIRTASRDPISRAIALRCSTLGTTNGFCFTMDASNVCGVVNSGPRKVDAMLDRTVECASAISADFGGGDARFRSLRHASSDRVRNDIIERLRDERANRWATAFAEAFGDKETRSSSVSLERLERALSDYQRSLEFLDCHGSGFCVAMTTPSTMRQNAALVYSSHPPMQVAWGVLGVIAATISLTNNSTPWASQL